MSEARELEWNIVANLRWLADRSDRPGYMPCGMLTGAFLLSVASRYEKYAKQQSSLDAMRAALESINRITSAGNRTLDEMIRDMGYANDRARAALSPGGQS